MADQRDIQESAQVYARHAGIRLPDTDYRHALITEPASRHLSNAYARLPHFDEGARAPYRAMAEETQRQFEHMTSPRARGGLGISVEATPDDPYGKQSWSTVVSDVRNDLAENNRIKVLSTKATGGHPYFSDDQNDMFRAVHDVYGHLGSGRGVDFDGEEAAYQKHSRMYTPLARRAMATETRGQNSYLRFNGDFPDQKVAILPDHMQALQFSRSGTPRDIEMARNRAMLKNREQGI